MIKSDYHYKNENLALERQKQRYFKRVKEMIDTDIYRCFFITFTFSNKSLAKTTQATRIRNIKTYLNKQAERYMLNIDYGKDNGREHYHAFILSRYKVIIKDGYNYGFMKVKKLHKTLEKQDGYLLDRKPLDAENITNHAFKDTTRNTKIIYSRASSKIDYHFKRKADEKLYAYHTSKKGRFRKTLYKALKYENKKDIERAQQMINDFDKMLGII